MIRLRWRRKARGRRDLLARLEALMLEYRVLQRRDIPGVEVALNAALDAWTRVHDQAVTDDMERSFL